MFRAKYSNGTYREIEAATLQEAEAIAEQYESVLGENPEIVCTEIQVVGRAPDREGD